MLERAGEVLDEDLCKKVLADFQNGLAGKILDFQAALFGFVTFFDTSAAVVKILEIRIGEGLCVQQVGDQVFGLASLNGNGQNPDGNGGG